ncbi:hypothetical protein JXM83_03255 [Candidatus Woesearchaeota archaeon]|nr:hypothetical protein [Candidatus Woesearchaeota archaeon]
MFGLFKKKTSEEHVSEPKFHNFVESLKLHLNSIKLFNHTMTQQVNSLADRHEDLSTRHSNNVEVMKQWIDYFNKKHTDTDDKIQILANYVKQLKNSIEKNRQMDEEFIRQIVDEYVDMPKLDKGKLKEEILLELNYVKSALKTEQNTEKIVEKTEYLTKSVLTNSEKWLLNVLFNSSEPLTYEQIVAKTGKSLNTLRVYMNSLKNKGSLIEETTLPNGTKVFAVSNRERINKLYNVQSM